MTFLASANEKSRTKCCDESTSRVPTRCALTWSRAAAMARPDRRMALGLRPERKDGAANNLIERVKRAAFGCVVSQLPDQGTPPCGQAQLVTARDAHPSVRSEESRMRLRCSFPKTQIGDRRAHLMDRCPYSSPKRR